MPLRQISGPMVHLGFIAVTPTVRRGEGRDTRSRANVTSQFRQRNGNVGPAANLVSP
jgi:hypothetical protein